MEILSWLVFIVVQSIFIPLAIVGGIPVSYKQVYVIKRLGASSTAIEIINGRWTMDVFDLRRDTASVKLMHVLPNTSVAGLWLVLLPSYIRYRISGTHTI